MEDYLEYGALLFLFSHLAGLRGFIGNFSTSAQTNPLDRVTRQLVETLTNLIQLTSKINVKFKIYFKYIGFPDFSHKIEENFVNILSCLGRCFYVGNLKLKFLVSNLVSVEYKIIDNF